MPPVLRVSRTYLGKRGGGTWCVIWLVAARTCQAWLSLVRVSPQAVELLWAARAFRFLRYALVGDDR